MFPRLRNFSHKYSFFLFGPRGTGKSALLKKRFDHVTCYPWKLGLLECFPEIEI